MHPETALRSIAWACLCVLHACASGDEQSSPSVSAVNHWGHYEEAKDIEEVAAVVHPEFIRFRLGPHETTASHVLDGHAIDIEFVESYEVRPPGTEAIEKRFCARTIDHCEDSESFMRLRINGTEAVLLREQLKEVTCRDGYSFLISAPNIEDMRESQPSDLVLIRFK